MNGIGSIRGANSGGYYSYRENFVDPERAATILRKKSEISWFESHTDNSVEATNILSNLKESLARLEEIEEKAQKQIREVREAEEIAARLRKEYLEKLAEEEKREKERIEALRNASFGVGVCIDFYGVDNNCFKLGDHVFEAEEDESDGYRSCLREVHEVTNTGGLIFFQTPIAKVVVQEARGIDEGFRLLDVLDNHVWLEFGTDNTDDYYPYFVFNYYPKAPKEVVQ
jgi:hypothetical protein